jgi:hypothetical protein
MRFRVGRWSAWAAAWLMAAGGAWAASGSKLKQRADKLASEARTLANPRGCEQVEECAVAGFGHKACGGPREYIGYCTRTTDVKALRSKLDALEKAERAWQQEAGIKSKCGLTRRPVPRFEEGMCLAR